MSKYSRNVKIVIAKRYLDDESSRYLSQEYNISSRQIRYWGAVYFFNHEHSFLPPVLAYSAKDKLKVLTRMQTEDWSLGHTSAFFNLSLPGTLSVWLRNYEYLPCYIRYTERYQKISHLAFPCYLFCLAKLATCSSVNNSNRSKISIVILPVLFIFT